MFSTDWTYSPRVSSISVHSSLEADTVDGQVVIKFGLFGDERPWMKRHDMGKVWFPVFFRGKIGCEDKMWKREGKKHYLSSLPRVSYFLHC